MLSAVQHILFVVGQPSLDDGAAAQRAIFFGMTGVLSTVLPFSSDGKVANTFGRGSGRGTTVC